MLRIQGVSSGLESEDRRLFFQVDINAERIPGLEAHPSELLGDLIMALNEPVNRPYGVSHGVDAVCIVGAEMNSHLVLGNEGVGLGQEVIHLVQSRLPGYR